QLFVDDEVTPTDEDGHVPDDGRNGGTTPRQLIQDLLHEGQQLLVQVAKDPLGTKGARITTHISLPGRHVVFMPTLKHLGISRRIEDEAEPDPIKNILKTLKHK